MRIIHTPTTRLYPWQAFFDDDRCVLVDHAQTRAVVVTGSIHESEQSLEVPVTAVPEKVINLIKEAYGNAPRVANG